MWYLLYINKKLSCRRETAQWFVSLNISLTHSRSLKVIRNGTIRQTAYEFLLVFHCNYGLVLHHFLDKERYWSKIAIFHTPAFDAPVTNITIRVGIEKRECGKKVWEYVYSFWHNTRTWQTDRRTDGQMNTARQHRPRLCIASRGKKITISCHSCKYILV